MFERFTDEARRAVVLAQEEARMFGHDWIGTEHLLLGLLHEGSGPATDALAALQVSADGVRGRVEQIVGRGRGASVEHLPFTPRAKKVLELSLRESLRLGDDHIGAEHVLFGLIREGEGVAALALVQEGVDLERLRAELAAQLPAEDVRARSRGSRLREGERRRRAGGVPVDTPSPLERLDDGGWAALLGARRSARSRSAAAVGVRDVLVGIAGTPGAGATALAAAGLDPERLVRAVSAEVPSDGQTLPSVPPFGVPVRERLRWAVDDADRRGHAVAGTGHLLLAVLTTPDVELAELLRAHGVDQAALHAEAARALAEDPGQPGVA